MEKEILLSSNHKKSDFLTSYSKFDAFCQQLAIMDGILLFQHIDVIQFILDKDARANISNNEGLTPFHLALEKQDLQMVQLFLPHDNSSFKLASGKLTTPAHYAVEKRNLPLLKTLWEGSENKNPPLDGDLWNLMHSVAAQGNVEVAQYVFTLDENSVYGQNLNGMYPLHLAVLKSNVPVLQFLCSKMDSILVLDALNFTPLDYALKRGNQNVAKMLQNWT